MVWHFARIIAQAAIVAAPILWKSFAKAYAQAAARAPEYGRMMQQVNPKRIQPMLPLEAYKIFGAEAAEVRKDYIAFVKRYKKLMNANERSFYLQSKIYRAKEAIDRDLQKQGFEFPVKELEAMEAEEKAAQQSTSQSSGSQDAKKE